MSKRKRNESTSSTKKKSCLMLKNEWFSKITEMEILSLKHRQKVKLGDIFIHRETNDIICSICSETNASPVEKSGMSGNWTT
jgi:hypothetical protein